MYQLTFWNGNKSVVRQQYELQVLTEVVRTWHRQPWHINNDVTNFPKAEDEGSVLSGFADVTVTVAGNSKFAGRAKIVIDQPIAKGLLGLRLLIIKRAQCLRFAKVGEQADLKPLRAGIPATWADAEILRANGCQVVERGSFEEVFARLKRDEFDYVSLGANEVLDVYHNMVGDDPELMIEPTLMLYYPLPLVFYVAPDQLDLADHIRTGLQQIERNGVLAQCFDDYYGFPVRQLNLSQRRVIELDNPLLQGKLAGYQSPLMTTAKAM
ncbi:ABC transporter substrate-binding protein [Neiella sp. HB171785]|uniref:ABC transporter substrate-binding protein n=1 Tax=Neiella litorisoli TaxID=2771431 RepID=A0A8J6QTK9_9GAMM|nr:ABC transporter substrate-binding protein [Neiella litorisoli]MBD1388912.1 ABC transporter substrate-binding protein [Neiella litorisoli]